MSGLTHDTLWLKYERLFAESGKSGIRHPIEFGIEVGPGWLPLLDGVLGRIADEVARLPLELQRSFRISQIKEKFSELRIYYAPSSVRIAELVFEGALYASRTCSECGGFGSLYRVGSYLSIRCGKCVAALAHDRGVPAVRVPTGERN